MSLRLSLSLIIHTSPSLNPNPEPNPTLPQTLPHTLGLTLTPRSGNSGKLTGHGAPSHSRLNPRGNTSRSLRSTSLALLSARKATPFARRCAAGPHSHPPTARAERAWQGRQADGMQQQLKEGEFRPPAYSKLICRSDGPRVVWVSFTRVGSPSCVM